MHGKIFLVLLLSVCLRKPICMGSEESAGHFDPWKITSWPVLWGQRQRCFPVHARLHLSMLVGLWSRLSWCPQCCFTRVIFVHGKWNAALKSPEGTCSLYHHFHHNFQSSLDAEEDFLIVPCVYLLAILAKLSRSTLTHSPLGSRGNPVELRWSLLARCKVPHLSVQMQR